MKDAKFVFLAAVAMEMGDATGLDYKSVAAKHSGAVQNVTRVLGLDLPRDLPDGFDCPRSYLEYDLASWLDGIELTEEIFAEIKNLIAERRKSVDHLMELINRCEQVLTVTS